MEVTQEVQQTSLDNLPKTSSKEEDLVNKILSELEDNATETVETRQEQEDNISEKNEIYEQPSQPVYINHPIQNPNYNSYQNNLEELKEKETFLSKLFGQFDFDELYYYAKLTLIATIIFMCMTFFSHKLNFILEKIPTTLDDNNMSTNTGKVVLSIIFGLIFGGSSIILLK